MFVDKDGSELGTQLTIGEQTRFDDGRRHKVKIIRNGRNVSFEVYSKFYLVQENKLKIYQRYINILLPIYLKLLIHS